MLSSCGQHFSRLDHLRGFAAYLVFMWHALHMTPQFPVPYGAHPVFPLALFDEGHTGVALFMTLSGYLFAKLVGPHDIDFPNFLQNRALRLGPLLIVCITAWVVIGWLAGTPIPLGDIIAGVLLPTWPSGTWSISVEMHFYLLFPILLFIFRWHGPFALVAIVATAILLRYDWWLTFGEAQHIAYWTIFGRIDQFSFGILFALVPVSRNVLRMVAGVSFASFLVLWKAFDQMGGFYSHTDASSQSLLWVAIPTIEVVTFGSLITFYDGTSFQIPAFINHALTKIGEWSYSIYLLHFFPIIAMRHYFWGRVNGPDDFYWAWPLATLAFAAFLPVAAISCEFFEKPFLTFRRPYLRFNAYPPAPRISSAADTAARRTGR